MPQRVAHANRTEQKYVLPMTSYDYEVTTCGANKPPGPKIHILYIHRFQHSFIFCIVPVCHGCLPLYVECVKQLVIKLFYLFTLILSFHLQQRRKDCQSVSSENILRRSQHNTANYPITVWANVHQHHLTG